MDRISEAERSKIMSRISSSDTSPERSVRQLLTSLGLRYRLNVTTLPGRPDIVLQKQKLIFFVNGCFWHLHGRCKDGRLPKSKTSYWHKKLTGNKARDIRNSAKLKRNGWKVVRIWECQVERYPHKILDRISSLIS